MSLASPAELLRRLRYLLLRDRYTADLEEEMRLHRELRAVRLQGGGLDPDAARYTARRKFGNATHHQERSRDMWGMEWIDDVAADFRFAIRRLRNRPAFSISTIAVAALGIGATTAVFSAVDAAILRPLPFFKPAELVTLSGINVPFEPELAERAEPRRALDLLDIRAMPALFSGSAAYAAGGLNLEDPANPRRVRVGVVTASLFSTLGVQPSKGRAFTAQEGMPGGTHVALLSDALWRNQFGRGEVTGKRVMLHGQSYEIIGVMPAGFSFPNESDLWIPMSVPTTRETFQPFRGYLPSRVVARMAPGVATDGARAQLLARWAQSIGKPDSGRRRGFEQTFERVKREGVVVPLQQDMVGGQRKAFFILIGATTLLLLIACANVANLLLSDGASRRREVALRETLGASRGRIVRQLLAESVVLSLSGAVVGLALAPATLGLMRSLMPADLIGTAPIQVDLRVLLFATALALVTGIAFGLWPAVGASRVDASEAIKSGGGHGATAGRLGSTRRLLIVAELSLTVMLLVGAGLMLKSFHTLMSQDFGMDPERTGTLELTFPRATAATVLTGGPARRMQIIRTVLDRLRADPQIAAAGIVNDLPLRGGSGIGISIEADGVPKPTKEAYPRYLIADGGYFQAMGIPLLRGRTFNASDDTIGQRVAIVNKTMAETFWPKMEAVGRTFMFGGDTAVHYMVVGVVADVRESTLEDELTEQMYFSAEERGVANVAIVARSKLPPAQLLARLTGAVRQASPTQAVFNVRMMDDVVGQSVAPRRTNTILIAMFGALALALSAFGVYAVVSYSVTQRSREFGIRTALGARRADILGLVSRDMVTMIGLGLGIGLAGAWGLTRVMSSLLYGVSARDLTTFLVVPAALVLPAAIATLVPALRAVRVSPTEVMRAE